MMTRAIAFRRMLAAAAIPLALARCDGGLREFHATPRRSSRRAPATRTSREGESTTTPPLVLHGSFMSGDAMASMSL